MVEGRGEKQSSDASHSARDRENGGLNISDAYGPPARAQEHKSTNGDQPAGKGHSHEKLPLGGLEIVGDKDNGHKRVSPEGLNIVKHYEGLRLKPYADAHGELAIGYGHHIKKGEDFSHGITAEKAERLLRADLHWAQDRVRELVAVPLTQGQYDALVSFTFNVGHSNFERSALLKKLNSGDMEGAAREFDRWIRADKSKKVLPGLVNRRHAEKAMFMTGAADL